MGWKKRRDKAEDRRCRLDARGGSEVAYFRKLFQFNLVARAHGLRSKSAASRNAACYRFR
jgi:hypothetical protein